MSLVSQPPSQADRSLVPVPGVVPPAETRPEIIVVATPAWKRTVDVAGALSLVVMLAPLMVLIATYIKCVSRGSVLFIQSRVGYGGEQFRILKFRTMKTADAAVIDESHREHVTSVAKTGGAIVKPDHEGRMILGGEWLRRSSIDELPQLFNVLIGNMSLVGPRPDVLQLEDYEGWQLDRFGVLPGLTGLWQVSGKNALSFNEMIALDLEYIKRRSFWFDVRILAKTVSVVLTHNNE